MIAIQFAGIILFGIAAGLIIVTPTPLGIWSKYVVAKGAQGYFLNQYFYVYGFRWTKGWYGEAGDYWREWDFKRQDYCIPVPAWRIDWLNTKVLDWRQANGG